MLNHGFGRWLGDPYPYPDYRHQSQLNGLDWLWWHEGNDIDFGDMMDDYVYVAPVPPYPYTLAISPEAYNVTNERGCFYLRITSNYDWSITCADAWLTCEPTSGTGNATIIFRHAPNTGAQRTSTATITCAALTETLTVVQDVTATNDDAYTNTRHVLVIYAQHETSLEDPLAPGEYNDTATAQYLSQYKHLGYSMAEWIADGFSLAPRPEVYSGTYYPPLPVLAEHKHGDYHPMDCIHVGLSGGAIAPYIVPKVGSTDPSLAGRAERANGYFVSQAVQDYVGGATNSDGWASWFSGTSCGYNRAASLMQEIMQSDYLATHLDAALKYDKNISGKFDMIILALPQLYKYGYYLDNDHGFATVTTLFAPKTILGTEYTQAFWQPYSRNSARILHHEYMHMAFTGRMTNELLADKTWVGTEPTITVDGFVPDVYCNQSPRPSAPWNGNPCIDSTMEAPEGLLNGWCGTPHPLISASMGMTTLNRWATTDGNYAIGNCQDTMDFLCIQSPYDQEQYMVLTAYYPQTLDGVTDYPFSGEKHPSTGTEMLTNGVYATVFKFRDGETAPYTYSNINNPIVSYMIDTMTEHYGYGDIGIQDTRTVTSTSNVVVNAKAVLLDHDNPTINPSGLSNTNPPFGVLVEWVGWSVVDGVNTATVTITFDTP